MSINVQSSSETPEQVQAILNPKSVESSEQKEKSAQAEKPASETLEASDASIESEVANETDDESVEGDADESQEQQGEKESNRQFKKRIDKLAKKLSAREREIEYWKQEALKGKGQSEPRQEVQDAPKERAKADGRPKADDFESHADYVEALTEWKLEQALKVRAEQEKQNQIKTEFQTKQQKFNGALQDYGKKNPEFFDAMETMDAVPLSNAMRFALLDTENAPEIIHELSKDLDEWERLNTLSPTALERALGKIEARLELRAQSEKQETVQTKTTKAPPPLKPVGNKATATKSPEDMTQAEYEAWRAKQKKAANW